MQSPTSDILSLRLYLARITTLFLPFSHNTHVRTHAALFRSRSFSPSLSLPLSLPLFLFYAVHAAASSLPSLSSNINSRLFLLSSRSITRDDVGFAVWMRTGISMYEQTISINLNRTNALRRIVQPSTDHDEVPYGRMDARARHTRARARESATFKSLSLVWYDAIVSQREFRCFGYQRTSLMVLTSEWKTYVQRIINDNENNAYIYVYICIYTDYFSV